MAAAAVVHMERVALGGVVGQHDLQAAAGQFVGDALLQEIGEPHAGFGGGDGGGGVVDRDRARHADADFPAPAPQFPLVARIVPQQQLEAGVPCQLVRMRGPAPAGQVARRADDDPALRFAEGHGDHVFGDVVAVADAGIVAFGHDVDGPVFDDDGEPDLGTEAGEFRDRRLDQQVGRVGEDVDPQLAVAAGAGRVQFGQRQPDLVEAFLKALGEGDADLGRRNRPA